jgi:outer membrane immunogenic protein
MMAWNGNNIVLGTFMKKLVLGLAFLTSAAIPFSPARAADIAPPPVSELRPAIYIGVFGQSVALDGHYNQQQFCDDGCPGGDPSMSGIGWGGGVMAGIDYQMDNFVIGAVGDFAWGGQVAKNDDPAQATFMNYNDIATIRGRAGFVQDNTMFYLTAGAAAVNTEFGGKVGPFSENISDEKWVWGWTAGIGVEHAFTENFHGRLEWLYVGLPDEKYTLVASEGSGGTVDMKTRDLQMIRAGITYDFTW